MEDTAIFHPSVELRKRGSGTFRNTRYSPHEIFIILIEIMEFLRQDFLSLRNH
jgi:hypothetical protein